MGLESWVVQLVKINEAFNIIVLLKILKSRSVFAP